MRLIDFIDTSTETILTEREVFARSIWPHLPAGSIVDPAELRDDAEPFCTPPFRS